MVKVTSIVIVLFTIQFFLPFTNFQSNFIYNNVLTLEVIMKIACKKLEINHG